MLSACCNLTLPTSFSQGYFVNHSPKFVLLGLTLALGACSVLQSDKVDYKSATTVKAPSLEVPPDLTQMSKDTRYNVPGSAVTASSYQLAQNTVIATPTAAAAVGDVRLERSCNTRWLVVTRPADKLWEPGKEFWQDNGFLLAMDQANLGIMETDWAENRAMIPQDFVRATLGKVFDSLYSTGERDKFRTRLERGADGSTEIFISHRGMIEVYDSKENERTVWQPRATDPELETEFLRRLMVKLGVGEEQSKALVAAGVVKESTQVATVGGQPVVQLADGFDRAWRRVGLSLDRTNFTVEDRDRSKGLYFVRYVAPNANMEKDEPGFFGKLFGKSKPDAQPSKFRVVVLSQDNATTVSVQNADGSAAAVADAQRIIKVLAEDLK